MSPAFKAKIDNFMILNQSKYSMKEHHHFELIKIDYEKLDILSEPYSSLFVNIGKWGYQR